jgi:hypothetical protein
VRILAIVQGVYGRRIADHIRQRQIPDWTIESWELPTVLPPVIDYPEDYLPVSLPAADLLLSLGEHPGAAELLPDIAQMCGARAALVPIDNQAWLPAGLMRQFTETTYNAFRLMETYDVPLVAEFARQLGRPEFRVTVDDGNSTIAAVEVLIDTPCGCACHVAKGLVGVSLEDAEQSAGMLHHHFPCLAGMAIDPPYSDTLMHISGRILQEEVSRNVKPHRPQVYVRPQGWSG